MTELAKQIEAVLFVAGEGIAVGDMGEKLGATDKEVLAAVEELRERYADAGVQIVSWSAKGGSAKQTKFQFGTNAKYAEAVAAVLNPVREKNLTRAALETMAIIAYKQPITKLEIDDIRGVQSDYAVHVLLDNGLIEVVGKKDAVGKPILYGTTEEFLKRFELTDIKHLPSAEELMEKLKTIATNFDFYDSHRA